MPELKAALTDLFDDDLVKQTVIDPLADRILIHREGQADPKYLFPHQITQSIIIAGDTVPAGTEIDITAIPPDDDGQVIIITGTTDIETITIAEGESRTFKFQDSGGKLVNSSGLPLPGGVDIIWSADDELEFYGVPGGVKVIDYRRASGVPVKPGFVRVSTMATGNVDIANDLNDGDPLNGVTLGTDELALLPFQSDPTENGIYKCGAVPARAPGFESFDSHLGVLIDVTSGTYGAGSIWTLSDKEGVLGTDALNFIPVVGGYARSAVAGNGLIPVRPIVAKTSNYSVLIGDDQTVFTNTGASGTVKFTLPANASCVPGKTRFRFIHLTNQDIQVEPASGNIYGYCDALGAQVNATNGSPTVSNAEIAAWIEVTYMGSDVWHAELNGRWT